MPADNIQLYRSNLNLLDESLEVVQGTSAVIPLDLCIN